MRAFKTLFWLVAMVAGIFAMLREQVSGHKPVQTIDPAVLSTDTNGASVDSKDFGSVTHYVTVGESGDTLSGSVKVDLVLQDSDDDSVWADVTNTAYAKPGEGASAVDANGIFATIDDAAEDDVVIAIAYIGPKRYSRVQLDFTGTHSNGIPIGAIAVKGHARNEPV